MITSKSGKRFLSYLMSAVILLTLLPAMTLPAQAATAPELVSSINSYGTGGGTGGALSAVLDSNDTTNNTIIVTNTGSSPITGAANTLGLDIGEGITVVWKASLSGATAAPESGLIALTGSGTFQVEDGLILSTGGTAIAVRGNHNQAITISGGKVASTGANAIDDDSINSTMTITGGEISSASTDVTSATIRSSGHLHISGTAKILALNGQAIRLGDYGTGGAMLAITGGTITANSNVVYVKSGSVYIGGGSLTGGTIAAEAQSTLFPGYYIGDRRALFGNNFSDTAASPNLFKLDGVTLTSGDSPYTPGTQATAPIIATLSGKLNWTGATVTASGGSYLHAGGAVTFTGGSGNITITVTNAKIAGTTVPVSFTTESFAVDFVKTIIPESNITFNDGSKVYTGGELSHETASISGYTGGTWMYTYAAVAGTGASLSNGKPLTAGTYNVTATYETATHRGGKTAAFTVNPKALTITGVTAADRDYDGTTSVTLSGGALQGVVNSDDVGFTLGAGTMADANAGAGKAVTTNITLTGTAAGNYTLTQPGVTVSIAKKTLTIASATVAEKEYDGNTNATVTGVTFSGLVGSETLIRDVDYTMTGTFDSADTGTRSVTVSVSLVSEKANNYLSPPDSSVPNVSIKPKTILGIVTIDVDQTGGTDSDKLDAGDELTANISGIIPSGAHASLHYAWYRDGEEIIGETDPAYIVQGTAVDPAGALITVKVIGEGHYTGDVTGAAVEVGKQPLGGNVSISASAGTAVGGTLTLDTSNLTPDDADVTVQWYQAGVVIPDATDPYIITQADQGKTIMAVVAGKGDYTGTMSAGIDIPAVVPEAPQTLMATAGNGQVTLSWAAPAHDGGSAVTRYEVYLEGSSGWIQIGMNTSYTYTGLTNGTQYNFKVRAVNSVGNGAESWSSATPAVGGSTGGGTGGGTSNPTIPAADGAVQVSYIQSGGMVTLTLPDSKVTEIIGKSDGAAVLDLSGVKNATSATLPKKALTAFSEAGLDVEIRLPEGTVTLSSQAAASVARQADGSNVSLEVRQVPISSLTSAQREAVKDGEQVIDISIFSGSQKISSFNGTLTVTVPYTGALPVAVWHLNDAGELEKLNCSYNVVTKTVSFTLVHLSLYVVGLDTAWANPFVDVKNSDWFYASAVYAVTNGLFDGTSETTFSPGVSMTRAMFATVLARLGGVDLSAYKTSRFSDVHGGQWYTAAIEWAADKGIVSGVGDGRFSPDTPVSRQDMTVMLWRYAKYAGIDVSVGEDTNILSYNDAFDVAEYAIEAIQWACGAGIVSGKPGGLLDPEGTATRAEAATIFARFVEALAK